jgi:hypothetical protein
MANNLPLAVAIADIARMTPGNTESVGTDACALTHRHPESDFNLSDISAALRDQHEIFPGLSHTGPSVWYID